MNQLLLIAGAAMAGFVGGILIIPAAYRIGNYSLDIARSSSVFTIGIIATAGLRLEEKTNFA
ncbi:MAG: hypothetical protein NTV06_09515 [candidate division Zixibacteria bacterium]|nr:hypothetical protein [candidate division Zixibacteria bacterium]